MTLKGLFGPALALALAPILLSGCSKSTPTAPENNTTTPPPVTSKLGTTELNVTYCSPGGVAQRLDIYYPLTSATSLFPVIVYIHGGQLFKGNKNAAPGTPAGEWRSTATPRGYAVVSIDYRLGPTYRFPAMIEDANCAIRYLRANAAAHSLDSNRIGVTGTSSGGYLAALVALADPVATGFAGSGGWPGVSNKVHAAVVEYGADMDPQQPPHSAPEAEGRVQAFTQPIIPNATVINHVGAGDPPFFFIHGERDVLVDAQDNRDINARLLSVGVQSSFTLVTNGVHGWAEQPWGAISPTWTEILQAELAFFDTYLK
jgi:acetyl esterase/lipase